MLTDGFPDTSLHIGMIYDLDNDGTMDIIGGVDSLWIAKEGDISNKLYFYSTTRDIYDLSVGQFDGTDRLIVFEKDSSVTYMNYFEWSSNQNDMEQVFYDTLDFANAVFVNDSTGDHVYKHISDDFFYSAYVKNIDGTVDSVSNISSLSLADIDLDGEPEYLFVSDQYLYIPTFIGKLEVKHLNEVSASGFPVDSILNSKTALIKNMYGDEHPEIVVQNLDNEIVIINWQGDVQYRLTDYGSLICLGDYAGRNAIVTKSAIWVFDETSENYGNEWTSTHHDFGNTRTLHLNIPKRTPDTALIDKDKTYVYPNPVYDGNVKLSIVNFFIKYPAKSKIIISTFSADSTAIRNLTFPS